MRPADLELRIVPAQSSAIVSGVELRDLVKNHTVFFQRLEAVSKTFRDVHHPAIIRRQFRGNPLQKGVRIRPQINDYVVDGATSAAHNLCLRMRGILVMQPAQRSLLWVLRNVALDYFRVQTLLQKLVLTPGA